MCGLHDSARLNPNLLVAFICMHTHNHPLTTDLDEDGGVEGVRVDVGVALHKEERVEVLRLFSPEYSSHVVCFESQSTLIIRVAPHSVIQTCRHEDMKTYLEEEGRLQASPPRRLLLGGRRLQRAEGRQELRACYAYGVMVMVCWCLSRYWRTGRV